MMRRNMGKLIVGVASLILLVVSVSMASHRMGRGGEFAQSGKEPVLQSGTPVSKQANEAEGIILGKVPGQPIEVVKIQIVREGDQSGNLLMEIENKTDKSVTFARYWLVSMPCRQYNISALFIDYGLEGSVKNKIANGDASLAPHQKTTIQVKRDKVERYLKPTGPASMPCRPNDPWEKPALSLRKVRFADGSVWDLTKQPQATNPRPVSIGPAERDRSSQPVVAEIVRPVLGAWGSAGRKEFVLSWLVCLMNCRPTAEINTPNTTTMGSSRLASPVHWL
jgi:hypothetical protein